MTNRIKIFLCLFLALSMAMPMSAFASVDQDAQTLAELAYGEATEQTALVAGGANDFAFRLSTKLVQEAGTENFVFSPYSVWLPIAALLNATDAAHQEALLEALGAIGVTEADVNQAAYRMLYDLTKEEERFYREDYDSPLQIANAIFVRQDMTLNKDFTQSFADYFKGTAMNLDFSSPEAVDIVNQWASDNTEGLITDLVQEFDPMTIAVIANAIYFSDRWEEEFNPKETEEDVFHAPSGDSTAFYMLCDSDSQYYYEDTRMQAICLPFLNGGGMYILLPKDETAMELLSAMTQDYFDEIRISTRPTKGKLLLPRFAIENDVPNLRDALEALGVPLFDIGAAPLTGGLLEGDMPVWLSDAMQKAIVKVDEEGLTAAAVTLMYSDSLGMEFPSEPFEMNCNKPFVFLLCQSTADGDEQVLFTGVVNQP